MDDKDALARSQFVNNFDDLALDIHMNNIRKGFYNEGVENKNQAEMIALIHSELSEALEALRHHNPPSDHIPNFSSAEEELADVIIRVMDMAEAFGYNVAKAIIAKMNYNTSRSYKHGGKKF